MKNFITLEMVVKNIDLTLDIPSYSNYKLFGRKIPLLTKCSLGQFIV